ncbi:hypothetical protein AH06_02080 [candidate division TM6 bacterium Zodletone_IIa]|nr:hypothetical protein AH06_02080 [candidate division TM6 bacterium Zodletone_IIa]
MPKNTSAGARIVTLTHPQTGKGTRYFVCPENGEVYEFTQVRGAEGKRKPRGWLVSPFLLHLRSGFDFLALLKEGTDEEEEEESTTNSLVFSFPPHPSLV